MRLQTWVHAFRIAGFTFTISLIISYFTSFSLGLGLSLGILALVILIGVIFDVVGTAVTAAEEKPFHAMGAVKVRGSREAIYLIRNADKVANFCNDVVGDIAGTISGALAASIILQMVSQKLPIKDLLSAASIALIAACTVGGKSLGKSYAIDQAHQIVFTVGKLISILSFINTDLKKTKRKKRSNSRKAKRNNG